MSISLNSKIESDSSDATSLFNEACQRRSSGDVKTALEILGKILTLNPNHSLSCLLYASIKSEESEFEAAIQYFNKAILDEAVSADAHYGIAVTLKKRGDLPSAEAEFKEALALNPCHESANEGYATLLLELGRLDEAEKYFAWAFTTRKENEQAFNNYGVLLTQIGASELAFQQFHQAQAVRGNIPSISSYLNIYLSLRKLNRITEAREKLEEAIGHYPENTSLLLMQSELLIELKQYPDAEKYLLSYLANHPEDINASRLLAKVYTKTGKLTDAILENCRIDLWLNPDDVWTRILYANLLDKSGLTSKAKEQFEVIHHNFKDNRDALLAYSQWLLKQKQNKQARQILKDLVKDHPDFSQAYLELIKIASLPKVHLVGKKDLKKYLEKVLEFLPNNYEILYLNALLFYSLDEGHQNPKKLKKAQSLLLKAHLLAPWSSQVRGYLANLLLDLKEEAKAEKILTFDKIAETKIHATYLIASARLLTAKGKYEEAANIFNRLKEEPVSLKKLARKPYINLLLKQRRPLKALWTMLFF